MLPHTDYVLVCIKAVDPAKYKLITGCEQHSVLHFINEVRCASTCASTCTAAPCTVPQLPLHLIPILHHHHAITQLEERAIPYWLRYVYVPGVTDSDADVADLVNFAADKQWMQAVEVLPYHRLGVEKWHQLGLEYPMEEQHVPSTEETRQFVHKLQQGGLTVLCAVPTS